MINFVGADGQIRLANPEWERTLGWTLDELTATNTDIFAECYPDPKDRQKVLDFLSDTTGQWVEFKTRVRDGRVIDTSWAVVQLSDGTRIGIGIDVSARKQSEEKLRNSQRQLAESQRLAHVGSWDWDLKSGALYWSDEIYNILDLDTNAISPSVDVFISSVHPADRNFVLNMIAAAKETKQPQNYRFRILRSDGSVRILETRSDIFVEESGTVARIAGMVQDVTTSQRMQEQLERSNALLRALSERLRSAREEEGARISREIHDQLGSSLTGLRWDLEALERLCLDTLSPRVLKKISEKSRTMVEVVDSTIAAIRRIAAELRPSILDDLGLTEAIEWEVGQFEARTGIRCHFRSTLGAAVLNQEQTTALFRIFQEALTNALRHAQATMVEVSIEEISGSEISLVIADNGVGISEERKAGPSSLGILGMRERAHLIGGTVEIVAREENGTQVTVTVPMGAIARRR